MNWQAIHGRPLVLAEIFMDRPLSPDGPLGGQMGTMGAYR